VLPLPLWWTMANTDTCKTLYDKCSHRTNQTHLDRAPRLPRCSICGPSFPLACLHSHTTGNRSIQTKSTISGYGTVTQPYLSCPAGRSISDGVSNIEAISMACFSACATWPAACFTLSAALDSYKTQKVTTSQNLHYWAKRFLLYLALTLLTHLLQ
jgi:hypothetical protein